MKKESCTQIVPTAEVRLGDFVAKFTENDLSNLKDVAEFANESVEESVRKYDDFIINHYNEIHEGADKCMRLLDGLRGYVHLFKLVGEIEVRYEPAK
jgi:hypothetical protein